MEQGMQRFRRLRKNETIRSMMRETRLHPADLIYPIFVIEGENIKNPVDSMPGVYQYSIDRLNEIMDKVKESGISGVLLFGIPACKDEMGTQAYAKDGITQRAVSYIKKNYPEIYCIVDVCLCEYTSHGHCGVVRDGQIVNDETLPLLCRMSVSLAEAGADMIAPSDMMDGRVEAIRDALDLNGFEGIPVYGIQRQVCICLLWSVQGCGSFSARLWGQEELPDGFCQWSGSCQGNRFRH